MTEFFCTVAGNRCTKLTLSVPQRGAWYVDAILDDAPDNLSGSVLVVIGTLKLRGTVRPNSSGDFVLARSARILAGGGGWGTYLKQRHYHDDNGLDPKLIAQDAARECGEVLGSVDFGNTPRSQHYTRRNAEGSVVLDRLLEGTDKTWWVDADGVTQIGTRATPTAPVGSYQIDSYSPIQRLAVISLDDPAALWIGSILTDRVTEPQTIRDLEVYVQGHTVRINAFTGGDSSDQSRLGRAFDALLEQWASRHLFGKYRYRVFSMAADGRANLQVVRRVSGLPDVLPVTIRPGAPGIWADLVKGSEVWVEFEAGDAGLPMVTAFAGKGEPGHVPNKLELAGGGAAVARQGDTGVAFFPNLVPISGTSAGVPFTGVLTITTPIPVQLTSGSGKVTCG
jgi:hypothetical protein